MALADRCLTIGLPEFGAGNGGGSFRRIVQTPGALLAVLVLAAPEKTGTP